jgi:signal peptidase I
MLRRMFADSGEGEKSPIDDEGSSEPSPPTSNDSTPPAGSEGRSEPKTESTGGSGGNDVKRGKTSFREEPLRWTVELIVMVAVVGLIVFLVQAFIVRPFSIPSGSMIPTLKVGQRILADRISLWWSKPSRGDIMVFHPPSGAYIVNQGQQQPSVCGQLQPVGQVCNVATPNPSSEYFVKRVIGLPGERFKMVNGQVFINGKPLSEPYAVPCNITERCNFPIEVVIPQNQYFMMGDNRPQSDDSRFWGPVKRDYYTGFVFFSFWPPSRIGPV